MRAALECQKGYSERDHHVGKTAVACLCCEISPIPRQRELSDAAEQVPDHHAVYYRGGKSIDHDSVTADGEAYQPQEGEDEAKGTGGGKLGRE